jgi:hypothetical protein
MIRMEGLDEHLDQAAAAESETEEDVGGRRVVVREDSGASVGEPRPNTFREIALHAAAADQAKSLAIFTDDGPRAGAAVRRPVCADDRDEHAALAGAGQRSHRGDDSISCTTSMITDTLLPSLPTSASFARILRRSAAACRARRARQQFKCEMVRCRSHNRLCESSLKLLLMFALLHTAPSSVSVR